MAITKRTRKLKNGKRKTVYTAEVYIRGQRQTSRTFENKSEAYSWHDRKKSELETGNKKIEYKFSDVLELYQKQAGSKLRRSSQQSRATRLPYLESPVLSGIQMKEFRAESIDRWIDWLLKHPTKDNPGRKSFKHELKYLAVVLNWYRNDIDAEFSVPILKRHRRRVHFKNVSERRSDYFVRPEDIQEWIIWLKDHRQPVYPRLALFMVLTGIRVGEATGLLWDAIDLRHKNAQIFRTVSWDHSTREPYLMNSTKTKESTRVVILPEVLVDVLRVMKAEALKEVGSDKKKLLRTPLFQSRAGKLLKYNAIQSAFNAGFRALELPWRSTHICRHTFATLALFATKDMASVQASLGHRSIQVTEKYAKAVALLSHDNAEKTADVIGVNFDAKKIGFKG
jgi:integrase